MSPKWSKTIGWLLVLYPTITLAWAIVTSLRDPRQTFSQGKKAVYAFAAVWILCDLFTVIYGALLLMHSAKDTILLRKEI